MRFFTITFAAALCLGAFVQAAPGSVKRGGATSGSDVHVASTNNGNPGGSDVIDQSYTRGSSQDVHEAGQRPPAPGSGGCGDFDRCPTGPSSPTDCVGIIQSLLRELYPTLDFTAEQLDIIVADVLRLLGAHDLSYAFLHGRIGLLNDLLALLGCTLSQLLLAIERVVTGII
ncbi:hypothetical protein BX666DRAFT_1994453 [Dichotomocladium elegans]|nr:hypothetical protein BX666DRAFT_1994453 [Dichotomocladium elegans]